LKTKKVFLEKKDLKIFEMKTKNILLFFKI